MLKIQAGKPRIANGMESEPDTISDAIEASFCLKSEFALIIWNYIPVLLNYKYDISIMIDDIIEMLNRIRNERQGELSIRWPSQTFECTWSLEWKEGNLSISTEWKSVVGHTEDLLNKNKGLIIDIESFQREWKKVLFNTINALETCGYTAKDLSGFDELVEEFGAIKKYGIFYE